MDGRLSKVDPKARVHFGILLAHFFPVLPGVHVYIGGLLLFASLAQLGSAVVDPLGLK